MTDLYYQEIFETNGQSYHKAMIDWPAARDQEFEAIIDILDIKPKDVVLDVPAGGGYLKNYLPKDVVYVARDFAAAFGQASHNQVLKCSETDLGFKADTFDFIICLAALHHIENKADFFKGVARILKPSGVFLIGDVVVDTVEADFLNGFVDRWNKLGHNGDFIQLDRDKALLKKCGFSSAFSQRKDRWVFDNEDTACHYFRHLFALNKQPEDKDIKDQLSKLKPNTEISKGQAKYDIEWSLGFIEARLI